MSRDRAVATLSSLDAAVAVAEILPPGAPMPVRALAVRMPRPDPLAVRIFEEYRPRFWNGDGFLQEAELFTVDVDEATETTVAYYDLVEEHSSYSVNITTYRVHIENSTFVKQRIASRVLLRTKYRELRKRIRG